MHLARLQMKEALNAVLDCLRGIRLDPDHPKPLIRGFSLRGPRAIQVCFDA